MHSNQGRHLMDVGEVVFGDMANALERNDLVQIDISSGGQKRRIMVWRSEINDTVRCI